MTTRIRRGIFILSILLSAQLVAEAELKVYEPLKGEKYRRTVTLRPVLEISDKSGDFMFQHPRDIRTDGDGNIYIKENNKILKFDPNGKFLKSFLKKGEGPGEVVQTFDYRIAGDTIHVYCRRGQKYMAFDREGKLRTEHRFNDISFGWLLGARNGRLMMNRMTINNKNSRKGGFQIQIQQIISVDPVSEDIKTIWEFPLRMAVGEKGGMMSWDPSYVALAAPGLLMVNHTREYDVKIFDLDTEKILARVSRKIERIPAKSYHNEQMEAFVKKFKIPQPKYVSDIWHLFPFRERIWVFLAQELGNNHEVDVYNLEGEYVDHFYIDYTDRILNIDDGHIYIKTENGENVTIKKCLPVGL